MQDAVQHLQCNVPHKLVDTFTVNGILKAAAWLVTGSYKNLRGTDH